MKPLIQSETVLRRHSFVNGHHFVLIDGSKAIKMLNENNFLLLMKCKNCSTNTSFISTYFSFKFSNGLSYFFVGHYMCASVETKFSQCHKSSWLRGGSLRQTSYPGAEWQLLIHFTSLEKFLLCTIIPKNFVLLSQLCNSRGKKVTH